MKYSSDAVIFPWLVSAGISLWFLSIVLLAVMLFPDSSRAQQAVRSMDRNTLGTGDVFTYHIRVTGIEAFDEVIYPDSAAFAPDFEIRDKQRMPDEHGDSLIYTLQFFGMDTETVPELYVQLVQDLDTLHVVIPEQPFVYRSRVDDTEAELRPLKPIFPFFRSWWPVILGIILLAVVAGLLLYRYRHLWSSRDEPEQKTVAPPEPFQNPVDDLKAELRRIRKTYPKPEEAPKLFYTELGDAFRTYIEHAHGYPALESTTDELRQYMESARFDKRVTALLTEILEEADLVKFARYQPNETDCQNVIKQAGKLAGYIAGSDKHVIEQLRRKHEEEQKETFSEESGYDLG